ncbi:EAL domain-containing protein [bacterium]|nr:EAL domain-containing protein [bacterium]MBU1884350.1 EAL domain-containing protein [bacterium]
MSNLIKRLQSGSEHRSVLIIEDDIELAESLGRILKMFFEDITIANDGVAALELFKEQQQKSKSFTLVVSDLELPKKGGLALIKEIRLLVPSQPVMIVSAHDEAEFLSEAIALDVQGYLLKPLSMPKLFENLEKILFKTNTEITAEEKDMDPITRLKTLPALESYLSSFATEKTILLRIKVNHLSNIYNLIGEEYADGYIRELIVLLNSLSDAVFYRIGLDEFCLVLNDKELDYANNLAKDMVLLAKYFHISENGIIINSTLSIGLAQGATNLLKYSKFALQGDDNTHPNSVVSYTQNDYERNLSVANGREVMKMIYTAIEDNNIVPYIQPIVNIKTDRIELFNSYVRIFKEEKIYGPETFLTIAENAHQVSMITRSMIKNTFALKNRVIPDDAVLIVYLSEEDFYDESLLLYITFLTNRYKIDPSKIGFEIVHKTLSLISAKEFSLVEELKELGYKIILSRFGFDGNLSLILELKPDYIKIDPQIVEFLQEEPEKIWLIEKIIEIIHSIGAKAIVTHISNDKSFELISSTDIDCVQGYNVGYPYKVK